MAADFAATAVKYPLSRFTIAAAVSCSLILLKPLMSEKKIVTIFRSAGSGAPSLLPIRRVTMRGSTNLPNTSLMRSRSRSSATMRLKARASSPTSSLVVTRAVTPVSPCSIARVLARRRRNAATTCSEPTLLMAMPITLATMKRMKLSLALSR